MRDPAKPVRNSVSVGERPAMDDRISSVFAALADPTRRRILEMLLEDDQALTDIAAPFEMSLTAISKHVAILAAAGLVTQEKRGRIRWCGLSPEGIRDASVWLEGFGQYEAINLEAFETFLEKELTEEPPSTS